MFEHALRDVLLHNDALLQRFLLIRGCSIPVPFVVLHVSVDVAVAAAVPAVVFGDVCF